jgi:hypothetical protein
MTLRSTVLKKLAEKSSLSNRRSTLSIPDEGSGWSVGITSDRRDEIGCIVWEFGLRFTGDSSGCTSDSLSDRAQQVAARVSGLLEPLQVIEIDRGRDQALLRSAPPSVQGDRVAYYEAILTGGKAATFRRYLASVSGAPHREQTSFTLTNEVLAKLISDVAGTD